MSQHGYSKLTEAHDDTFAVDGDHGARCVRCGGLSRYHLLKLALAVSTMLLALSLVGIMILVNRMPASSSSLPETRFMGLGRDSRYMTRNHSADALWDVYLEDHLGEYATPEGPFDRAEFSM
jgi:hypothetical protein